MSEFIYILENPSMPGLVKIGRTERSVSERVSELSSHTGVPTGFAMVKEYAVANSFETERIIHARLSDYRVADNREFFRMEAEDAADIIESILETAKPETRRDFEREDELIARAIPIVVKQGTVRPRMLEETLGISYEEALFVIHALRGRGVIGQRNESRWTASSNPAVISQKSKPVTVAATQIRQTISSDNYRLPDFDLLNVVDHCARLVASPEELLSVQNQIIETLSEFGILVTAGDITKGPTITRYEVYPARGVRLDRIATYERDIARATLAEDINILDPIPGKDTVGIEIANSRKQMVTLRELLENDEFLSSKAQIPLVLGKDLYGKAIIADLADMPHLLIAGNTGSGKSVCLNLIIVSLLYRFSPENLRFVMIDPDGVELQLYNTLPHLVVPVVTDPNKAILVLRWLVNEMEKRFAIFLRVGATHVRSFNARPRPDIVASYKDGIVTSEELPYIVVVIENLEGLMQAAKADVETLLDHLAQNARAAGIHLVLTTQQANQNVISESTKAEIPARIAFRCGARIESRSVVGEAGAEKLLGNGDLLYRSPGASCLVRAQCALVTDEEISRIVEFVSAQGDQCFGSETLRKLGSHGGGGEEDVSDEDEEDVQKCLEVMQQEGKASTSLFQRRLRIGYTRAVRILDILEDRGYVGPGDGAKPREILRAKDEGVHTAPANQLHTIRQHLVVCACDHCREKIEFDANELGDRQSVSVPCPHCGVGTTLSKNY